MDAKTNGVLVFSPVQGGSIAPDLEGEEAKVKTVLQAWKISRRCTYLRGGYKMKLLRSFEEGMELFIPAQLQ